MDTAELMKNAVDLMQIMALRDGPRNADDQLAMAQTYAMLAVGNELKRLNDNREAQAEYNEAWAERERMVALYDGIGDVQ
jgi:hypothetical protein